MNYKLKISYNGSLFYGFAKQKNLRTVQGLIENVLFDLFGLKISVFGSGRTDRYVHAIEQVISFKHKDLNIDANQLKNAINSKLENDIYVFSCEIESDKFHARFSAINKTYIYKMNIDKTFNPIMSNLIYQYNKDIDFSLFDKYSQKIIGTHDFLSFSTSEIQNTVRTINYFNYKVQKNIVIFEINGNGFLRNMVRIIIGVFLNLVENKISFMDIDEYFQNPKKGKAIRKIDACGLYLYKVNY